MPQSGKWLTTRNSTAPARITEKLQVKRASVKRLHQHDDAGGDDRPSRRSPRGRGEQMSRHLRTAPKVMPRRRCFRSSTVKIRIGRRKSVSRPRPRASPAAFSDDGRNVGRRRLRAARGEQHGEGVLVPGEDQAEDRRGRDTGHRLRQHDLHKGLEAGVASIIAASSYSRGISSMKPFSSQTASDILTAV